MAESRRTFAPVVLLGLAAAGLAAVAGAQELVTVEAGSRDGLDGGSTAYASSLAVGAGAGQAPLAGALALVLLACWGVLLVTRGRVRRVVTWLALVTAVGLVATVVTARLTLEGQFLDVLEGFTSSEVDLSWSPWTWALALGAVLSVLASGAAVRLVGTWPEMGSRYDAPTGAAPRREPAGGDVADENQALWKAIDEGHDPTR